MCELIISVIDKTSADLAIDAKLVKRGVVIEVFEDDHVYGKVELAHPMFRILKIPGASMKFGQSLLGSEIGDGPYVLHRKFKLDLDHADVPETMRAHLADDTRQTPAHTVEADVISAIKCARPSYDPTVIGNSIHVIG